MESSFRDPQDGSFRESPKSQNTSSTSSSYLYTSSEGSQSQLILVHFQIEVQFEGGPSRDPGAPSYTYLNATSAHNFTTIIQLQNSDLTIEQLTEILNQTLQEKRPPFLHVKDEKKHEETYGPTTGFLIRVGWATNETRAGLQALPMMDILDTMDLQESLAMMRLRGWRDHLIASRSYGDVPRRSAVPEAQSFHVNRFGDPSDAYPEPKHHADPTGEQRGSAASDSKRHMLSAKDLWKRVRSSVDRSVERQATRTGLFRRHGHLKGKGNERAVESQPEMYDTGTMRVSAMRLSGGGIPEMSGGLGGSVKHRMV